MADFNGVLKVAENKTLTLVAGERLVIQVVDSEGVVRVVALDKTVPTGKTFECLVGVNGDLL